MSKYSELQDKLKGVYEKVVDETVEEVAPKKVSLESYISLLIPNVMARKLIIKLVSKYVDVNDVKVVDGDDLYRNLPTVKQLVSDKELSYRVPICGYDIYILDNSVEFDYRIILCSNKNGVRDYLSVIG